MNNFKKIKKLIMNNILFKIISLFISLFIVIGISFLIRYFVLDTDTYQKEIMGNFLGFNISFNKGVSFSNFSNNLLVTYLLQIVFSIIVFICIFLVKDKWLIVLLGLVFSGGTANIIDRSITDYLNLNGVIYYNTVVDYLQFTFIKNSAIFNFQDCVIVISWIVVIIRALFIVFKNKNEGEKNEENNI